MSNTTLLVESGNYTLIKPNTVNVTLISDYESLNLSTGNFNFTYVGWNSTEYLAVQNSTKGLANLSAWLPIIAVVLAAGLVIGVVAVSFSLKRSY